MPRSASVVDIADALGVESRVGATDAIDLDGIDVVVNLAGPFAATAAPLARRCVEGAAHYVDIAGEVTELRSVRALDASVRDAGVTLLPGAGFGVVPTDCLAVHAVAVERLPDATHLDIAFATTGGVSGGTLRTLAAGFGDRGEVTDPTLERRGFDFAVGRRSCIRNPWRGDLLTAPLSTGVTSVATWIALPGPLARIMAAAHRRGDAASPPWPTHLLAPLRLPPGPPPVGVARTRRAERRGSGYRTEGRPGREVGYGLV